MYMKLRNLLYATMVACAFASCSKDDTEIVGPEGPDAEATATLEVKIANPSTKALPSGATADDLKASEDKVNTLQLLVFNGTEGTAVLEAVGEGTGLEGADVTKGQQSVKVAIKPGNKQVIVLANVENWKNYITVGTTTYSQFLAVKSHDFANEKEGGLTMNSKKYNVNVVGSNINYMGYGSSVPSLSPANQNAVVVTGATDAVKLYRNVAKIVLNKITFGVKVSDQYKDATLKVSKIFILHAHKNTALVGAGGAEWGATDVKDNYLNGYDNDTYANTWVKYMEEGKYTAIYNYIVNGEIYEKDEAYSIAGEQTFGKDVLSEYVYGMLNPFYVYENAEGTDAVDYRTLLVVEGVFSYKPLNADGTFGDAVGTTRYYPIAVGYNQAIGKDKNEISFAESGRKEIEGLFRNLQYNVNLSITGPGYNTPFGPKPDGEGPTDPTDPGLGGDTFLDSKVEVVPFGVVSQSGEIE